LPAQEEAIKIIRKASGADFRGLNL